MKNFVAIIFYVSSIIIPSCKEGNNLGVDTVLGDTVMLLDISERSNDTDSVDSSSNDADNVDSSNCLVTYVYYYKSIYQQPIYKSMEDIRKEVSVIDAMTFSDPGKIYLYGNKLFINEKGKGVHIIDNTDKTKSSFYKFY